jgi:phospholipid/cholesterol/gamma-HCH transport system substrate-binding protein
MPSPKKVHWAQLKVGVMALLAFIVLSVLIVLLTGSSNPFAKTSMIHTYLGDSAAMMEGSAVRLNGILVGKVRNIGLSGQADPKRVIKMDLEIEQQYLARIPVDSIVGFSAENVLGSKFLNIKRGAKQETVKPGGEIAARDDKDFLEVVQSALPLLDSMQSILTRVNRIIGQVEEGKGSIGKMLVDEELYKNLNKTVADIQKVTGTLANGTGTIGKLLTDETLFNDVRKTIAKLDAIAADLQAGQGTAGKLLKDPSLYDELRKSNAEIRTLLADLNAGKGTAGKLLKDEALHNRIVATLDRMNGTLDKLNAGQGTLGQLMVNPALYENLTATTAEVKSLLKDFRANPKKFLTIQLKLF